MVLWWNSDSDMTWGEVWLANMNMSVHCINPLTHETQTQTHRAINHPTFQLVEPVCLLNHNKRFVIRFVFLIDLSKWTSKITVFLCVRTVSVFNQLWTCKKKNFFSHCIRNCYFHNYVICITVIYIITLVWIKLIVDHFLVFEK